MTQGFWGGTSTTTSFSGNATVFFRVNTVWTIPPPAPLRPALDEANVRWVEQTIRQKVQLPRNLDPREPQRLRTWLETLEFSPERPFDPTIARTTYRRLMREAHPDLGGDPVQARRLTAAWAELKKRGFVR